MSDEPTPELRALANQLFAAGRAERPDPAIGRRLLLIEPASAARQPHPPTSGVEPRVVAPLPRARAARLLWVGTAAIAAASAGLWWSLGEGPDIDMSPDPVIARARPAPVVPSPSIPKLGAESRPVPIAPIAREAAPADVLGAAPATARVRVAPPKRPRKASAHDTAQPSPAPARDATPAVATPSEQTPAPVPAAPASPPPSLSEELALLKEARVALRAGEAARALDVLDRDARAKTAEGLRAEATLLRIEALDALGRRAEASRLAARFVRENPFDALTDRAKRFIRSSGAQP